jgi:hypothetical protein
MSLFKIWLDLTFSAHKQNCNVGRSKVLHYLEEWGSKL